LTAGERACRPAGRKTARATCIDRGGSPMDSARATRPECCCPRKKRQMWNDGHWQPEVVDPRQAVVIAFVDSLTRSRPMLRVKVKPAPRVEGTAAPVVELEPVVSHRI